MKPQAVRIPIPESYGEVYEECWVERRIQIPRSLYKRWREVARQDYLTDDDALTNVASIMAEVYTAWNLPGLEEPWENPEAIESVAELDLNLFIWLVGACSLPLSEFTTIEKN